MKNKLTIAVMLYCVSYLRGTENPHIEGILGELAWPHYKPLLENVLKDRTALRKQVSAVLADLATRERESNILRSGSAKLYERLKMAADWVGSAKPAKEHTQPWQDGFTEAQANMRSILLQGADSLIDSLFPVDSLSYQVLAVDEATPIEATPNCSCGCGAKKAG